MSVYDETISKIRQLPEPLVQEVNDFVNFLLLKSDTTLTALGTQLPEAIEVAESDFSDYLRNLEDYEKRLARGEIQWCQSGQRFFYTTLSFVWDFRFVKLRAGDRFFY